MESDERYGLQVQMYPGDDLLCVGGVDAVHGKTGGDRHSLYLGDDYDYCVGRNMI